MVTTVQSVKVLVVVGAGVVGLSTAVCIADPHCSVTVINEHFTPNTSNGADGIFMACQHVKDLLQEAGL